MSPESNPPNDADVIVLIRRGDHDAYNQVLQWCYIACARRLAGWDEADPEDVAQEAAIKVILAVQKPDLKIRSSFRAFVFQVATFSAYDLMRKIRHERTLLERLDPDEQIEAPAAASQQASRPELYARLDDCMDKLSAQDQQIMRWRAANWGPAAIAAELGPPANRNAIGVRINRLRKQLARCLGMG